MIEEFFNIINKQNLQSPYPGYRLESYDNNDMQIEWQYY